jgi:hypothetical protein
VKNIVFFSHYQKRHSFVWSVGTVVQGTGRTLQSPHPQTHQDCSYNRVWCDKWAGLVREADTTLGTASAAVSIHNTQ